MNDNKSEKKAREFENNKDNQATPDMTSDELIESIRGKIQQVLAAKASNQNYSE